MKTIQVIKTTLAVIGLFALGVLTGALFGKSKTDSSEKPEQAKKDRKDEIEQTPADDLVSDANNADELRTEKKRIKADFRQRIRNRLNEELHRLGASGADSDCGAGSSTGY